MGKKIVSILLIGCLLTISIASANADIQYEKEQGLYLHAIPYANIYVDDDNTMGPWNGTYEHPYQHIQDGITAASDNDTVFVFSGTYKENLVITKSIVLIGESRETTIIDGSYVGTTICVHSSFVKISGFNVKNSIHDGYGAGITVRGPTYGDIQQLIQNISIKNCLIENNDAGIRLEITNNSEVLNCTIRNNEANSIYIISSSKVKVKRCEITKNGDYFSGNINIFKDPLYEYKSDNIEISECTIGENYPEGIYVSGHSSNIMIHHNKIFEHERAGIIISGFSATNINISNNEILNNGYMGGKLSGGVCLQSCHGCITLKTMK